MTMTFCFCHQYQFENFTAVKKINQLMKIRFKMQNKCGIENIFFSDLLVIFKH